MVFPRFVKLCKAQHGVKKKSLPAPLPAVSVHVGHGNVGEAHNGCHDDGPLPCTLRGYRRNQDPEQMSIHVPACVPYVAAAGRVCVCVHVGNRPVKSEMFATCVRSEQRVMRSGVHFESVGEIRRGGVVSCCDNAFSRW